MAIWLETKIKSPRAHRPKVLVLYYSMCGQTFRMVKAVIEGVREGGSKPILKQVAENIPKVSWSKDMKKIKELMKGVPIADPRSGLEGINGLILGTPTVSGICVLR